MLAALASLLVAWFAANRLLDEPVSPAQANLLVISDEVPDRGNVAVGILGLTAPPGSDFIQHGIRVKEMYVRNSPYDHIRDMVRGPRALRPTVEGREAMCWLDPDGPLLEGCLPFAKAPQALEENSELLARYQSLQALQRYSAVGGYDFEVLSILVQLSIAEVQLDLRKGDAEAAYRKWHRQLRFARNNLRGTDSWVGKAMGMVALGMTVPVLDDLLLARPELAKAHRAELVEALRPEGVAAIGPDGIVRAEFRLLAGAFDRPSARVPDFSADRVHWLAFYLGQKNRVLNRYAAFAPEYAAALRLPWAGVDAEFERLRRKFAFPGALEFMLGPFGSALYARFIDGQLKARELLRQAHMADAQLRLSTLLLRLLDENVRDADIPEFLKAAGPGLYDPFSAAPARWDPSDRKVYFVDPAEKCAVLFFVRVREPGKPRKPSPAAVNMRAC